VGDRPTTDGALRRSNSAGRSRSCSRAVASRTAGPWRGAGAGSAAALRWGRLPRARTEPRRCPGPRVNLSSERRPTGAQRRMSLWPW
jgi:hypothetical protein